MGTKGSVGPVKGEMPLVSFKYGEHR